MRVRTHRQCQPTRKKNESVHSLSLSMLQSLYASARRHSERNSTVFAAKPTSESPAAAGTAAAAAACAGAAGALPSSFPNSGEAISHRNAFFK
jgi:hypothetical protein